MRAAEKQIELVLPVRDTNSCLRDRLAMLRARLAAREAGGEHLDLVDDVARLSRLLGIPGETGGGE